MDKPEFQVMLDFLQYCCLAKKTIEMISVSCPPGEPPLDLPNPVRQMLAKLVKVTIVELDLLWIRMKHEVWNLSLSGFSPSTAAIHRYIRIGQQYHFGYRHMYPPVNTCITTGCARNGKPPLSNKYWTHSVGLFTLREGTISTFSTSFQCTSCCVTYTPNYTVLGDSLTRVYYAAMPVAIEASLSSYLDTPLLEFFAMTMSLAWVSSMNCARIYNTSLSRTDSHITNQTRAYRLWKDNPVAPQALRPERVLNGFFIYSLLLEHAEKLTVLVMKHDAAHRARLQEPLSQRNKSMEGTGQEEYTHTCDKCMYKFEHEGKTYKIQAAVSDGVTVGHPCCQVHDCKNPLESHAKRFCLEHSELSKNCVVIGCDSPANPSHRTCDIPAHREMEIARGAVNAGFFQLKKRLEKSRGTVAQLDPDTREDIAQYDDNNHRNAIFDEDEVIIEVDDEVDITECTPKSDEGNRKLRAYFGRRKTHNEQFMMRPCGVILSRCTFFGSEAISGVYNFFKATFPTPQSTPEFILFDNNCQITKHKKTIGCTHFKNTAFPVDVFHFTSKHKETDLDCQLNCNPAAFPELYDEKDNWRFNSSICEQTNVWVNGFQSILSDMEVTRYNFYLDEMVKRRNRLVVQELRNKGANPANVDAVVLLS